MSIDILHRTLLIRASAGSGKTYQLGNRVIGLVGVRGADPTSLMALTFTRKAAGEFADAVLAKLAGAALESSRADTLARELGQAIDVEATLLRMVRSLPRLQFGTIDSFFSRIVRGFPYELGLTSGQFELLTGPRQEAALAEIRTGLVDAALDDGDASEFLHAFRRATLGKEKKGVGESLTSFFGSWHGLWKSGAVGARNREAMPFGNLPGVDVWERDKAGLAGQLRAAVPSISWTDARQKKAFDGMIDALEAHTIGSGSLGDGGTLLKSVLDWGGRDEAPALKLYKPFEPGPSVGKPLGQMVRLLINCELGAAVERTSAVLELVERYDRECDRRLRRRGLLGFDDLKGLMSGWMTGPGAGVDPDRIDFRLDVRGRHWLLDEFQDTSPTEWRGLEPLLDRASKDPEGSLFVVGDVKQAIYRWRGGEVGLFDEVERKYRGDLAVFTMPESRRSCDAVLQLVNGICGHREAIASVLGSEVVSQWPWEAHVPAEARITGLSRVEVVPGELKDRLDRTVVLLREIGIPNLDLSCGILVRTNDEVRQVAERLRLEGIPVVEEGVRRPADDNVVGVALKALLGWLADPADTLARGIVRMSPFEGVLASRWGRDGAGDSEASNGDAAAVVVDWKAWEGLMGDAGTRGFAGMVERLVEPLWGGWSGFSRRRADDLIGALAAFDASGGAGARAALRSIEGLEVSQPPGAAAVQVMTIHKSKGLGFDVVILPEVEDEAIPNASRFRIAQGDGWCLDTPAAWVRAQVPALRELEEAWGITQRYDALCLLYVALTRAKRGLYVLMPDASATSVNRPSLVQLIRTALPAADGDVLWQQGDPLWMRDVKPASIRQDPPTPVLVPSRPLQDRLTATSAKRRSGSAPADSPTGMEIGTAFHAAFERVGWIDEETPGLPKDDIGSRVLDLVMDPDLREYFERRGRTVVLHREQPVEAILDGQWFSGVIDRLHVHEDGNRVEVLDFKTDAVESMESLVEKYSGQMEIYRRVMSEVYPGAQVECRLLSTRLRKVIRVQPPE